MELDLPSTQPEHPVFKETRKGEPLGFSYPKARVDSARSQQWPSWPEISRRIFELSGEGILFLDSDFVIREINPAYCDISGLARQELFGRPLDELYSRDGREHFTHDLKAVLKSFRFWDGEVDLPSGPGRPRSERLRIMALSDNPELAYIAIIRDISELRSKEAAIVFAETHDPLTGLPNRSSFVRTLDDLLQGRSATDPLLGVAVIDMDNFKRVNDGLSHLDGDIILIQLAARLREVVPPGGQIGRTGGDEFSIAFPFRDRREVKVLAVAMNQAIAAPFRVAGTMVYMTASIGVALFPEHGTDTQALLANADLAAQDCKHRVVEDFSLFCQHHCGEHQAQLEVEGALQLAISQGLVTVHYQPVYDIKSGTVASLEALARLKLPDGRVIDPSCFIPLAERNGLIVPLGESVLRTVSAQSVYLRPGSCQDLRIAVNISPRHFLKEDFLDCVSRIIAETLGRPENISIEITESCLAENVEESIRVLRSLKDLGVHISIDDFGTGYSSLSYLKRFPIDTLKIDQSFVRDMEKDGNDRKIVDAIISMAHGLGMKTIAEGVESQWELDYLRERGCEFAQGYYFSRALPAPELVEIFA